MPSKTQNRVVMQLALQLLFWTFCELIVIQSNDSNIKVLSLPDSEPDSDSE